MAGLGKPLNESPTTSRMVPTPNGDHDGLRYVPITQI